MVHFVARICKSSKLIIEKFSLAQCDELLTMLPIPLLSRSIFYIKQGMNITMKHTAFNLKFQKAQFQH